MADIILVGPVPVARAWLKRELRRELKPRPGGKPGATLIAVDGGLAVCRRLGFRPALAVGDWDSLGKKRAYLAQVPRRVDLLPDKDRSDLHHALRAARSYGPSRICGYGLSGGRADHELSNWAELALLAARPPRRSPSLKSLLLRDPAGETIFLSPAMGPWQGKMAAGTRVSVFAWGRTAHGVRLDGFKYRLNDGTLRPSSRGLSNRARGGKTRIGVGRGSLIVMIDARNDRRS